MIIEDIHRASGISIITSMYIKLELDPPTFDERKIVSFQLAFFKTNERKIKFNVKKLETFTNNMVKFIYPSKNRKLKFLFPLNYRITHKINVMDMKTCSCNE